MTPSLILINKNIISIKNSLQSSKLFKEFLNDRTKEVVYNNTFIEFSPIFSCVPQGGDIGPLLLIISVNYLPLEVDISSNINLFADYT